MMIRTLAPRGLQLRDVMADLPPGTTPADVARFLDVSERTVWRWLSQDDCPRAALLALWFCTRAGQHEISNHVGNEARLLHGMLRSAQDAAQVAQKRLAQVLTLADVGSANAPFFDGPSGPGPGGFPDRPRHLLRESAPGPRPNAARARA